MYNRIILIGRLVAEPELRQTPSGTSVCSFRIAVQRSFAPRGGERQTDFFDIVAWQQRGEFVTRFFHKGNMIGVEGRLETREYTDRNNQQRRAYEVIADNLFFVESRSAASAATGNSFAGNAPASGGSYSAPSGSNYGGYGNTAPAPSAPANSGSASTTFASGDFGDFQEIDSDEDLPF